MPIYGIFIDSHGYQSDLDIFKIPHFLCHEVLLQKILTTASKLKKKVLPATVVSTEMEM